MQTLESLCSAGDVGHPEPMANVDGVWERIRAHACEMFRTATGLSFSYVVPGNYLRVIRDGREINRSLSRTNFAKRSRTCRPHAHLISEIDKGLPTPGRS